MADWAMVIGVDKYEERGASLRGAVRDALSMRTWLVEDAGVPEGNVKLLLAPDAYPVPTGLSYVAPTYANISTAINSLITECGSRGERFYFHYAGHGLSDRVNYRDEDALLCSDFTTQMTTMSIAIESILGYFAATEIEQQFFFIDACRNVPFNGEFRIGYLPRPRRRDYSKPPAQQFVMYATSPGLKATEIRPSPGDEQGAFTLSLLDGLRGVRNAKAWDYREDNYVVTFSRLSTFVRREVEARKSSMGGGLVQSPRIAGEHGGSDPVLARFADKDIANETLTVHVQPFHQAANPLVTVQRDGVAIDRKNVTSTPVKFSLRPREYRVRGAADGYVSKERNGCWVELWRSDDVRVELERGTTACGNETLTRGFDTPAVMQEPPAGPAGLQVYSHDELAAIQVYDSAGALLQQGLRSVHIAIPAGTYRAVLRIPGADPVVKSIDVEPGEHCDIAMEAPRPSPPVPALIESDSYYVERDGSVLVSETSGVGPVAGVQLSTILAMAAGAALSSPLEVEASRLRNLGIQVLSPNMREGVALLVADETARSGVGPEARVGFGTEHGAEGTLRSVRPHVGEYGKDADPGRYWLAFETPHQPVLHIPVMVLSGHVCVVVVSRNSDGLTHVYEYFPSLGGGDTAHPRFLRKLELIERFYQERAYDRVSELFDDGVRDPLSRCLAGYTGLHLGRAHDLPEVTAAMPSAWAELSDSSILHAEYEYAKGNVEGAKAAYRLALDAPLPLVVDGVGLLLDAAREFDLQHPRLPELDRIYRNRLRHTVVPAWFEDARF
jgi:hypothetical protein